MANKEEHKYTSPVWTEEKKQWLIENTKGLGRQEAFDLFMQRFPDYQGTLIAVTNQRSRLKCAKFEQKHGSTKRAPLYAENHKKGYVRIKVAQPSVWWQKQKWVWIATHPDRINELLETDGFVFLDGNNRNFDWQNIEMIHRKEQTLFQQFGGVVPDNPEETRIHIIQARLKLAQLDALEKVGEVVVLKSRRISKEDFRKTNHTYYEKYKNTEAFKMRNREHVRKYREHMTEEQKARRREVARNWARKNREKKREEAKC